MNSSARRVCPVGTSCQREMIRPNEEGTREAAPTGFETHRRSAAATTRRLHLHNEMRTASMSHIFCACIALLRNMIPSLGAGRIC